MPVISHDLKTWMQAQAMALEDEVRTMSLRPKSMVEGVEAALAPPPAQKNVSPGKRDKNQSKRRMGPKAGAGRKHEQGEEADKSESDTRGEAKTRASSTEKYVHAQGKKSKFSKFAGAWSAEL